MVLRMVASGKISESFTLANNTCYMVHVCSIEVYQAQEAGPNHIMEYKIESVNSYVQAVHLHYKVGLVRAPSMNFSK